MLFCLFCAVNAYIFLPKNFQIASLHLFALFLSPLIFICFSFFLFYFLYNFYVLVNYISVSKTYYSFLLLNIVLADIVLSHSFMQYLSKNAFNYIFPILQHIVFLAYFLYFFYYFRIYCVLVLNLSDLVLICISACKFTLLFFSFFQFTY